MLFKDHLRGTFRRLTKQSKINDFTGYTPVSEEAAKAFGEGSGPGPHGDDTHRLYLGDGWRQAAWNHTVVATMASAMLMEAAELQLEPALSDDVVKAAIWDFVKQAWGSWSSTKPRVHESGERMESAGEALLRNAHYQSQRSQSVKNNNRKVQVSCSIIYYFVEVLLMSARRNTMTAKKGSWIY